MYSRYTLDSLFHCFILTDAPLEKWNMFLLFASIRLLLSCCESPDVCQRAVSGDYETSALMHIRKQLSFYCSMEAEKEARASCGITRVVLVLDHISPPLTGGSTDSPCAVAAALLHPYLLLSTGLCLVYSGSNLNIVFCYCSITLLSL